MASRFGGVQPIIFVGRTQPDVPWEQQRSQIVSGLKKAGDIGAEHGITFIVEPLSTTPGQGRMALDTAAAAFPAIEEAAHPRVKVCFDMYHVQFMEGNITANLRQGLSNGLIALVQIGEVPGRKEPGTEEIDYAYMMRILRELNYTGYPDTEMGTTTTPEAAMQLTRKMSLEAYGPIALHVAGTSEARFRDISFKDLNRKTEPAAQVSPHFRMQSLSDFSYSWGAPVGDINRDGVRDVVAGPFTPSVLTTLSATNSPPLAATASPAISPRDWFTTFTTTQATDGPTSFAWTVPFTFM